jgi:hypothetical protein
MTTDFSTMEASAIAEAFSPWTGVARAVLKVTSRTMIAANKATINRLQQTSIGLPHRPKRGCQPASSTRQECDKTKRAAEAALRGIRLATKSQHCIC